MIEVCLWSKKSAIQCGVRAANPLQVVHKVRTTGCFSLLPLSQVTEAGNTNIAKHRPWCVTFEIWGFVWRKNLSFLYPTKMKGFKKQLTLHKMYVTSLSPMFIFQAWATCAFVSWRKCQGSNNNSQKKWIWWIHTKKHRNTSKVSLLYSFYTKKVKIMIFSVRRLQYFISQTRSQQQQQQQQSLFVLTLSQK